MGGKRAKREILKRTDHRLDMGPAGHNLFISRDKQAQERSARRIKMWMRAVVVLALLGVSVVAVMLLWFYLVPYFQKELTVSAASSYHEASFESSEEASQLPVYDALGLPVYGDDLCLFVINREFPAEDEEAPLLEEAEGVQVDSRIAEAVRLLSAAAKEDGLALTFQEGYVPYEEQERRFNAKVQELMSGGLTTVMAKTEAESLVPMAGESDFQTGLCLRLEGNPETFQNSRTYSWLQSNMGKYGFVFRYPKYKEESTGLEADPTVIRYVGSANAEAMQQRSMCLEEYISYLDRQ